MLQRGTACAAGQGGVRFEFQRPITAWDASSNEAHWGNRPEGQPFFSVFNFGTTHESRVWSHADHPWLIDTTRVPLPPYYPDTPIIRRDVARHYNNIQELDAQQELLRLDAAGELVGVPALWFRKTKPVEELYDTRNDPHEIVNLADDPAYRDTLEALRAAHLRWKADTHDWGLMPETELVKRLWPPDGIQPQTEPVTFTASREGSDGTTVHLTCSTEGASIAYRLGEEGRWLLYTGPLQITASTTLYAQAIRIGFKHSEITEKEY